MNPKEIDRKMAEIMGWEIEMDFYVVSRHKGYISRSDFYPSINIAHAFEVWDKLIEDGFSPALIYDEDREKYAVLFDGVQSLDNEIDGYFSYVTDKDTPWADTPSMAICFAALEAVKAA